MSIRKIRPAEGLTLLLLTVSVFALAACSDDDKTTDPGPDTTRPRVIAVDPADGATDVPVDTKLTITFSEDIDVETMTYDSVTLTPSVLVPASGWKAAGTRQLVYTPDDPLDYSTNYLAVVDSALADLAGHTLAADFEWNFTTASYPLGTIDFPLEVDNTWLYDVLETSRVGADTTRYEGLEVLWAEGEISFENQDGWLIRRFLLDETATGASALDEDFCYVALLDDALLRADPYRGGNDWRNLIVFGETSFDGADFLLAGTPLNGDTATQRSVPYDDVLGSFWVDQVDFQFVQAGEITERRREHYADGFGLVRSDWQYANANDDVQIAGRADLVDDVNGPDTPWIERELEPNDYPDALGAEYVELTTIIVADAQLPDAGTILLPEDIECDFFTCVNEDIDGVRIIQDFYRFELATAGQYRFDLIYDQFDEDNDLDLYCFKELDGGGLRSLARADASAGTPEYIVLLAAEPGVYYLGIQAWSTPVPETPVDYTLSLRPQAVEIPIGKGEGRGFLASQGK